MKRETITGLMLTLLLVGMLTLAFNIQSVTAALSVHNIDTGEDFATIQEAINDPDTLDGHTILVDAGTYYEDIRINKTLTLQGENRETTIIHGSGFGIDVEGIDVDSPHVSISGFTIENAFYGIFVFAGAHYSTITDNIVSSNKYGIYVGHYSHYATIANNTVTDNSEEGISVWTSNSSTLVNNIVSNNGIGIHIDGSPGFVLRNNSMTDNGYNLFISDYNIDPSIGHDIDPSNTVNGKPVYYWINRKDETVPSDAGYVCIVSSINITVRELNLVNNGQGVLFVNTTNSLIANVNSSNNWWACIDLSRGSSYNTIINNTVSNAYYGLLIDSSHNTISDNIITNSSTGISLVGANFTVRGNTVTDNECGITLQTGSGNTTVYHNNFINNTEQAVCKLVRNTWDNGYPSGGNYWSDHNPPDVYSGPYQNETGRDEIGDEAYVINMYNKDRYPLIYPYGYVPSPDLNGDGTVNILDVILLANSFGSDPGHPNWNPEADLNKDGMINIFDAILIAGNFGKTS